MGVEHRMGVYGARSCVRRVERVVMWVVWKRDGCVDVVGCAIDGYMGVGYDVGVMTGECGHGCS